jgi:hypothetical protein
MSELAHFQHSTLGASTVGLPLQAKHFFAGGFDAGGRPWYTRGPCKNTADKDRR